MTVESDLHVRLDSPLPETVAVGAGTALFVCGTCVPERGAVASLALVVDGREQPVMAHGMPRLDVLRAEHPRADLRAAADDPAYRSGFWGFARIEGPCEPGAAIGLAVRARLAGGAPAQADLGSVAVAAPPEPVGVAEPAPGSGPLVAVAMATFDPPRALLERQIASIRAQTHANWVCVISDDGSSPEAFAALQDVVGDDPRFVVSRAERRAGFYGNFERALALVPREAEYVALADQDDDWYPDKLATLLGALGDADLVYSDARVVTARGEVLADTYWSSRRNNHSDPLSLLVANSVTGAASLLRAGLLADALPFPPAQFAHFHDHWLALVARARGGIAYVDRPLYDYVQHGEASLGHRAANTMVALRARLAGLREDPRERVRRWRLHYFVDACRLQQMAAILLLRLGTRMPGDDREVLERFLAAETSPRPLARLAGRGARELLGLRRPETLGAEWLMFAAFGWRRLVAAGARVGPVRGLRLDALPPPRLALAPGRGAPGLPQVRVVAEKVAPLDLAVGDAPERVNLLIPAIDLQHLFGGYIGKFNLAARLAERGARVRLVTVDPVGALPRDWAATVESYSGLDGLFDRVEVAFGRETPRLEVSRADRFVATTWWTAHIAHAALEQLDAERFLYLIQEYEPFTFPMGTWAALAEQSYRLPHRALFSTEPLRGYFRTHGLGVYAAGAAAGDAAALTFQNAITPVAPPAADELARRTTRRLLFYARPEAHAARNLFELGILALRRAIDDGAVGDEWELRGIGTTSLGSRLALGGGWHLDLLPRAAQGAYGGFLREHDVGLALMHTPHPSLVPIEMAAAGLLTVTSTFENKTAHVLEAISPNLIAAEPTVDAIAAALERALAGAGDARGRVAGAAVDWSRDWRDSLPDALLERVEAFLRG